MIRIDEKIGRYSHPPGDPFRSEVLAKLILTVGNSGNLEVAAGFLLLATLAGHDRHHWAGDLKVVDSPMQRRLYGC